MVPNCYLKPDLYGEPYNLVKHLPSTYEGYTTAWILKNICDNERASSMVNTASDKSKEFKEFFGLTRI